MRTLAILVCAFFLFAIALDLDKIVKHMETCNESNAIQRGL